MMKYFIISCLVALAAASELDARAEMRLDSRALLNSRALDGSMVGKKCDSDKQCDANEELLEHGTTTVVSCNSNDDCDAAGGGAKFECRDHACACKCAHGCRLKDGEWECCGCHGVDCEAEDSCGNLCRCGSGCTWTDDPENRETLSTTLRAGCPVDNNKICKANDSLDDFKDDYCGCDNNEHCASNYVCHKGTCGECTGRLCGNSDNMNGKCTCDRGCLCPNNNDKCTQGACQCTPSCTNAVCGHDDGCGSKCPTGCAQDQICCLAGYYFDRPVCMSAMMCSVCSRFMADMGSAEMDLSAC